MPLRRLCAAVLLSLGTLLAGSLARAPEAPAPPADPETLARGKYLVHAGACGSCHTDTWNRGAPLAGGRALKTRFGTFHVPNITPDPETGIGGWSTEDFVRAMTEGEMPDGGHYFPVFPYRWYRNMTRDDLVAMKAYLDTVPPVRNETPEHDLIWPFSIRLSVWGWKLFNLDDPPPVPKPDDPAVVRGHYLVNALGHCGACHTPSNFFQFYDDDRPLAGEDAIPGAYTASNITPHATGLGAWSEDDLVRVMALGLGPDGAAVRGPMADYVADGSQHLTPEDLRAMAAYLKAIPPIERRLDEDEETPRVAPEALDEAPSGGAPLGADLTLGRAVALGIQEGMPAQDACWRCHDLQPIPGASTGFPSLDGQSVAYLARQLDDYAAGTRASPVMAPIAQRLTPAQRAAVAAFYAERRLPVVPIAPPPTGNDRGRVLALEGDAKLGVQACVRCHGTLGVGVPPSFPWLAGQDILYMEQQHASWRNGTRRNDPLGVMQGIARRLSPEDWRAVSVYFARLPDKSEPQTPLPPRAAADPE